MFAFVDSIFGSISGSDNVKVDILTEHKVLVKENADAQGTETKYLYGEQLVLPKENPTQSGKTFKGWFAYDESGKEIKEVKTGEEVTGNMTIIAKFESTSTGGGGYVPSTPTTSTLDATKANAEKSITAGAAANKYDDAEQAEINKIVEKAKADIKAAKTEAEVKAIEEAAQKEIEAILTTADKEEIKAVQGVTGDKFVAKSKLTKLNGKKAVRITWNVPKGMKLDGFHVYKSSKRYSGYGKKPYFTTTKTSYINNKELEDGQTYYYKVRGFKVIKGQTVYTGYSTKAIRTIK